MKSPCCIVRWIPVFLLLQLITTESPAQNSTLIEKLKQEASRTVNTARKTDLLNRIAWLHAGSDSAKTFFYADSALRLAEKTNYQYGKGKALLAKGTLLNNRFKPVMAREYFETAYHIFESLRDDLELANVLTQRGRSHALSDKNDLAITDYMKAEKIFIQKKHNEWIINFYKNLVVFHASIGNREKGIEYYIKAYPLIEAEKKLNDLPLVLNNIGKLFMDTRNNKEARNYLYRCIEASKAVNDHVTLGKAQVNLSNVLVHEQDMDAAVEMNKQAITSFEKADFKRGLQACHNNLGAILIRKKEYAQSIPYLEKALLLAKENKNSNGIPLIEQNIGYAFTLLKEFEKAEKWFDKAELSASGGSDLYTLGEIYNHRSSLDSAMGDFAGAFAYKQKYIEINERLTGERVTRQVNELQTKYETAKKENLISLLNKDNEIKSLEIKNQALEINKKLYELAESKLQLSEANFQIVNNELSLKTQNELILLQRLDSSKQVKNIDALRKQNLINELTIQKTKLEVQKRNTLIAVITAGLLGLMALGYSQYRRYKLKQEAALKTALLEAQQKSARAMMEAEENERQRIAKDLHDGIGQMMSAAKMNLSAYESRTGFISPEEKDAFNKIISLVDDSCREVRSVSHNMMPNALTRNNLTAAISDFIDKIDHRSLKVQLHTEGFEEKADENTEAVLYRIIQECVNNCIKHADARQLDISMFKDNTGIDCTIEDDGKGFDAADKSKFEGMGLKNISTRVQFLKGTVEFDSSPGRGTAISIHIPL